MQGTQPLQKCTNCLKEYPQDRIDLHQAYCCRNIRKCPECSQMIDINEQENHNKQHHTKQKCQQCNALIIPTNIQQHQQQCPMAIIQCIYCQNGFPKNTIQSHEESCGSRTKPCAICCKLVILKDLTSHEARCQRRRDEVSQEPYRLHRRNDGRPELQRQNSTNNGRQQNHKHSTSVNKLHKHQKIKPSNIIGMETIKQPIDPVPISIRLALRAKDQRQPLKTKN